MGREPLLVLRKRDNLSCILNNPVLWREKILLLPQDWRRTFLGCAEGDLLSPSHLALCYIALWIIALPLLLDPAVVSHSVTHKTYSGSSLS